MPDIELTKMRATDVAHALCNRDLGQVEVLEAAINRIEEADELSLIHI